MNKYLSNIKSKWLNVLLLLIAVFLIKFSNQDDNLKTETTIQPISIDSVKKIFPTANKILQRKHNNKVYDVYSNGKSLGYIMYNNSDSVKGYSGKVPLILGVNNSGVIQKVVILENSETPAFLQRVKNEGLLKKWENLPLEKAKSLKVDVVSGATFSSNAIIKNVSKLIGNVKDTGKNSFKHSSRVLRQTIVLSILLFIALLSFLTHHVRMYRLYIHILNIIFFGFLTGTFLSIFLFNSWIVEGVDFFSFPIIYIIGLLAIVIPLFTNKSFYCVYVCPFGALQELFGKIGGLFFKKRVMYVHLHKINKFLLLLIFLILILYNKFDVSQFEPFTAFLIESSSIASIVIAVMFLILSLFYTKPWCKFCPTGKLLDICRVPLIKSNKIKK